MLSFLGEREDYCFTRNRPGCQKTGCQSGRSGRHLKAGRVRGLGKIDSPGGRCGGKKGG